MAATARDFLLSRVTDPSLTPHHASLLPFSSQLLAGPLLPASSASKRRPPAVLCCLVSGVDGGGVSDDFVSTRKSGFDRGFSVIANMLKRIEPLDNSVISKGVSDSARDSMKQTISTMLGLLPSDQFSVTVRVSKRPLDRLLASSIITGYTLWNAEYRISLMRNFDLSSDSSEGSNCSEQREVLELQSEGTVGGCCEVDVKGSVEDWEPSRAWSLGDLPPEALNYIQKLESELSTAKKELDAQKLENMQMEYDKGNNNNLLEYLRGLESDMVTELSKPSSLEVEEIIHQLVQNILQIFFKDDPSSAFMEDSALGITSNYQDRNFESRETICTSRDYLAKLLFWCMLLGHHFRGLENRLHLSCAVGLL